MNRDAFLSDSCPPMGIYETLYAFRDSFGQFMGTEGTHPWSQGFPLTTPLEGGPALPDRVEALRVHLERALGEEKFVLAYRALDNLSESDDEDKVVSSLCDVMGEDISYLGLIHQLLVCEDSMHAANEGVEE